MTRKRWRRVLDSLSGVICVAAIFSVPLGFIGLAIIQVGAHPVLVVGMVAGALFGLVDEYRNPSQTRTASNELVNAILDYGGTITVSAVIGMIAAAFLYGIFQIIA